MSIDHVTDRIEDLLVRAKTWLSAEQIAERLGADQKNVYKRLNTLLLRGSVERRGEHRAVEWRARLT